MLLDLKPRTQSPVLAIVALASASFMYVTSETLPIGLLPQIGAGLHVSDGEVGLLVTLYAALAGLTAIPLTALTAHLPRHRLMVYLVVIFALCQVAAALAPTYPLLVAARLLCALTHGVFWSMIAPIAVRLVAPGREAKATAMVFTGNAVAVVVGVPLGTALGAVAGWRVAFGVVGALGAVSAYAILRLVPALDAVPGGAGLRAIPGIARNGRLLILCAVTTIVVIGDFSAYTYISRIVQARTGFVGVALGALLLGYGAAGMLGNALAGRASDSAPRATLAAGIGGVGLTLLLLASGGGPLLAVVAVLLWGACFSVLPAALQSGVLRVAPQGSDTASALYVVAFQIGIGGGALIGGIATDAGHLRDLPLFGAATAAVALGLVLSARRTFAAVTLAP